MTILHASDLHFGKPHRPEAAAALVELAQEADAVVVSGDLTQRAKTAEYRGAAALLSRLGASRPQVAVPGNHDVPLYRIWERIATPYRKYRRHVAPDLDTVLDAPVAAPTAASTATAPALAPPTAGRPTPVRFVALNSSSPRRAVVNGRLSPRQLAFAEAAFADSPAGACRVLVVHHHLASTDDDPPPLRGASVVLDRLDDWGVDLVLSGHVHCARQLHRGRVLLIQAGTASSTRGRGPEQGRTTVNVVRVEPERIEVAVYLYSEDAERFLPVERRRHPRRARGAS